MRTYQQTGIWALALVVSLGTQLGAMAAESAEFSGEFNEALVTDPRYFTIESVTFEEITDATVESELPIEIRPNMSSALTGTWDILNDLKDGTLVLDLILNLGKKVWTIIEKNKPVVNTATDFASALPKGTRDWYAFEDWKAPRSHVYRITYKNGFKMNVVDFSYRVLYTYGGSVLGRGRYLTNVTVEPYVDVLWGYKFNAKAVIREPINMGSTENPVAGLELAVNWTVDTVMKHDEGSSSFFMSGEGQFENLTNGRQ